MNDEFTPVADLEDEDDSAVALSDDILDGLAADIDGADEDEDDFGGSVAVGTDEEDERGWGMD